MNYELFSWIIIVLGFILPFIIESPFYFFLIPLGMIIMYIGNLGTFVSSIKNSKEKKEC